MRDNKGAAPTLARWLRWRLSRASRLWSGRICLRYLNPIPGEVQRSVGRFAGGDRFSALAREFFRTSDTAQPRLLPEPRTQQSYWRGRTVSGRPGAIPVRRRSRPALPRSVSDYRSVCRWMVRQERLSGRWPDAGLHPQVCPGRIQENPGRTSEAPRCRGMSISCCAAASISREGAAYRAST